MEQAELSVDVREKSGKGVARKLRMAGKLPAVVYGKDLESTAIVVDPKELEAAISGEAGMNTLITLKGAAELAGKVVILKNADIHPLSRDMISADFHAINLTEKALFMVPVNVVGTAIGQKEGGTLQVVRNELEVLCLPTQVPQSIDIDVTDLAIGDNVHIDQVPVPAGVELVHDVNFTVLTLHIVKEEVEVSEDEELEDVEGAVAAEGDEAAAE
ncbi:LSU ribosomal protein L25P [Desulfuromusa kysingii]|uniref:Large ribosomal subunit protein bL25 n=1 Tax=Desulfuromusa kysingii TaxID=37625 RepID=A0A1H3ZF60_9BACT|nr:50S ribosomal protein L25 [Desulfuromusa kysingii]SEA22148.1 LSU ribosomal protein L25P [Desulfuromusa kysingii]